MIALFTADWCPFCRKFAPIFESFPEPKDATKAVVDLNDLENPLWERFDIRVVPTIIVFRDGVPIQRRDGVLGRGLPENAMVATVEEISAKRDGKLTGA